MGTQAEQLKTGRGWSAWHPSRPYTVGIGYSHGYVSWLEAEPHDMPLDAMLTEDGVFWERERDT